LSGRAPVFGILSPGSMVRIQPAAGAEDGSGEEVRAAVRDGFLSVSDDRVSILTSVGQLADDVEVSAARADLDAASAEAGSAAAAEESVEVRYARARLRAAGEQA
jgi:F-type H+-transporting ATPase subunit epsilon